MGKSEQPKLMDSVAMKAVIEDLLVKQKVVVTKLFKIEQALRAKNELITQLNGRVKSLIRPVDPAVETLRNDNRELRAKILSMMSDSTTQSRIIETLKKERDSALVQLTKAPIEKAAAAPPTM